jgi:DNA repair ATPase RecN
MKIKKVNELNNSKMFDDHFELLKHGDKYIENIYIKKTTEWNSTFSKLIEMEIPTIGFAYKINDLAELVEKEQKTIKDFINDCDIHQRELDDIYRKSKMLSEEDDEAYDKIEELNSRLSDMDDQLERYKKELKGIFESCMYINDSISLLKDFEFKLPI